jgi:hypothetical protein
MSRNRQVEGQTSLAVFAACFVPEGAVSMKPGVGAVSVGVAAVLLLIYEWDFGRRSRVGQAVVVASFQVGGRSGLTVADVRLIADARQVRATLRTWFCHLRPGQRVRVLYLPSNPAEVVPDWLWQRHYRSLIALALFTTLAAADALRFRAWRRRQAIGLLRDDYVGPGGGSRGTPVLHIDTAPRLWDQDLDG